MNALSLYVTTTRMVISADIEEGGAWSDIKRLMSYLRQSLTCCVCGQLLMVPMSSTVSSCQHHVCKTCVGGKMRLKPSCSWCKDHSKFIENIQLRILLQCYKQLNSYLLTSPVANKWGHLQCETNQASYSAPHNLLSAPNTFRQLLEEGANFQDKYNFSEPPSLRSYNRQVNGHQNQANRNQTSTLISGDKLVNEDDTGFINRKDEISDVTGRINSGIVTAKCGSSSNATIDGSNRNLLSSSSSPGISNSSSNRKVRRGCRCGLATPNPGKLTCCGQRCPCYVENKPCQQCKCRGCRNPNRVSNLATINIISSSSSSNSPIISIPSSSLFQIPILVRDEDESRELGESQVFVTATNIIGPEEENPCDEMKLCSTTITETDQHLDQHVL